jgi:5'-nucleotidase
MRSSGEGDNMKFKMAKIILATLFVLLAVFSLMAQQEPACSVKVTLLQVNDVYQFAPVDGGTRGGLARLMTLRKQIAMQSPHNIFLLAGDTISPSVESITYKGAQMIDAWNTVGLDYATFGSHEFDFGPDVLQERINESKFSWIAANVIDKRTNQPFGGAKRYVVREFGGVKVGLFGLVLPETKITSRPGVNVEFRSPCETAKEVVSELHSQGVQVVVALTHLSMREDKEVARCSGVNVIIGGHEHTLLESYAGNAPIFKMTSDARELGRIDLNIRPTGELDSIDWKVIPVDENTRQDPGFEGIYRKYGELISQLSVVIGRTTVALDARSEVSRKQETNLGNFIADSFRTATRSEIGFFSGGMIRADGIIQPGVLTQREVLAILPFKNKVIKLEVTGEMLKRILEHGVARSGNGAEPGQFPQVSGLRFTFDATRPPGSRVFAITVNGDPLEENRKYTFATSEFIAVGGDGYDMLREARILIPADRAQVDSDILRTAITLKKVIAPKTDGRIKRLDRDQEPKPNCVN